MKLIEKIKDRHNILVIILSLVLLIIALRVSFLTIISGEELREMADNSRQRSIRIDAPRGKIYDRYGRVLATNEITFTVQLIKDDIDEKNSNELAVKLMSILEEEGEQVEDEFPIDLNVLYYKDLKNDEGINVEDEIIKLIKDNDLIYPLLEKVDDYGNYKFITSNIAIKTLEKKGVKAPIIIDYKDGKVTFSFDENEDIESWKSLNKIPNYFNAKESLGYLIKNDINNIKKLLNYPIIRKQVYDILVEKGLDYKFKLVKYDYMPDKEIIDIKSDFAKSVEEITSTSSAKDDFINIITNYQIQNEKDDKPTTVLNEFLKKVYIDKDDKGNEIKIVPGKVLINKLNEIGVNVPIKLDSSNKNATYQFTDDVDSYIDKENIIAGSPLETLIKISKNQIIIDKETGEELSVIGYILTSEELKYKVQQEMIDLGINPKISTQKWEYTSTLKKITWLGTFAKGDETLGYTAEEAFNKLNEKYEIPIEISDYEKRFIFVLRDKLKRHSGKDYEPIDLAYNVNEVTISKVLENQNDLIGVDISAVPTRYYPMGETAAHILGYLGRISSKDDIDKYLNNREDNKYDPNDSIGAWGIEHKFEDYLKGMYGFKKVEVDVYGRTRKVIEERKPIPGNNIYLTIDSKLQMIAEKSLKKAIEQISIGGEFESKWGNYSYKSSTGTTYKNAATGSIVAIDVKTGDVLALANYPQFDPNLFRTGGISDEDWEALNPDTKDPLAPRPLYNLALSSAIQPGSTFKMVTGLAALEKGISPYFSINSRGYIDFGGQRYQDWQWNRGKGYAVGPTNLYTAIKDSVNYYFYTVTLGKNLRTNEYVYNKDGQSTKVTFDDITRVAKEFGLNDKTGIEIDIPSERYGNVPQEGTKEKTIKNALRNYLKKYIKDFLIDDNLEQKDINKIIDSIVAMVDNQSQLSNSDIINELKSLGLDTAKLANDEYETVEPYSSRIIFSFLRQAEWDEGDALIVSIGQGENAYTPIQMANYIATLANEGYRNKVSVIDSLKSFNGNIINFEEKEEPKLMNIKNYKGIEETEEQKKERVKKYLDELKKSMLLVSTEGTSRKAFGNFPVLVGTKTGTAEKEGKNPETGENYDSFGWFVAFAPYDDPQIAIAGVIFQGGSGGNVSPAAREIIAEYLGLNNVSDKVTFENKLVK